MEITIPIKWKLVNLDTVSNANDFGEALRNYCFIGNCMDTGCYTTFKVDNIFKRITKGKIFNEVKNNLPIEKFATDLIVYYYKRPKVLFFPAIEIVIGWYWDADGCLYFRYNNRSVINTDCKCDYTWEWIKAEK